MPVPQFPNRAYAPAPVLEDVAKLRRLAMAGETAIIPIAYGRVHAPARIATATIYNDELYLLCVWCQGEIDQYNGATSGVYMGDKELPSAQVNHHYGTVGQAADAWLVTAIPAYADTLPNIAYSVIKLSLEDGIDARIYADLNGSNQVYDPRGTPSTGYSINPSLCLANFIDAHTTYTVDWTSVETCADANDSTVGLTASRRVLSGLMLDTKRSGEQWIEVLREYAAVFIHRGEELVMQPNRPRSADFSYTDSDIKSLTLEKRGMDSLPTRVTVRYTDRSGTEWKTGAASYTTAGSEEVRTQTITLPGIARYQEAYRQAQERAQYYQFVQLHGVLELFDEGLDLIPGDVIDVTHNRGLTNALFRVLSTAESEPGRWRVEIEEYSASVYTDSEQSAPTLSDTDLPRAEVPDAPSNIVLLEEAISQANGLYVSRVKITWDAVTTDPYLDRYEVQVLKSGDIIFSSSTGSNQLTTPHLEETTLLTIRVRAVNPFYFSTWATETITLDGKTDTFSGPTGIGVDENIDGLVTVTWNEDVTTPDIAKYELRYGDPATSTWATSTSLGVINATRIVVQNLPSGSQRFYVKSVDSVGTYSTNSTNTTHVVGNVTAGGNTVYYQSTPPGSGNTNDLWIDTDDNLLYIYNGGWFAAQDDDIATAISDASTAQGTADGKVYIFWSTTAPSDVSHPDGLPLYEGDLWIDTDDNNRLYRWDDTGNQWVNAEQVEADWSLIVDDDGNKPDNNATQGATVGTDLKDTLGNTINDDQIFNNDDASILGLNPTFSDWPGSNPTGWSTSNLTAVKEETIKLTGPYSVECVTTGGDAYLLNVLFYSDHNIQTDAVIYGSFDVYIASASAAPGIRLQLHSGVSDYFVVEAEANASLTGQWQRVYFLISNLSWTTAIGSPNAQAINRLSTYLVASGYGGFDSNTGTCYFDNLRLVVSAPDLSGAYSGTNLYNANGSVIPDSVITNNDEASLLGFNPTFSEWEAGDNYPANWTGTGTAPVKEETIKLWGPYSLGLVSTGAVQYAVCTRTITYANDSVIIGSYDIYVDSASTSPGLMIRMKVSTNVYYYFTLKPDTAKLDQWQRVYFKLSGNSNPSNVGTVGTSDFTEIQVFLIGSWSTWGFTANTGTCYFDNFRLSILDPSMENERQLWSDISGDGLPADNAGTNGQDIGDLVYNSWFGIFNPRVLDYNIPPGWHVAEGNLAAGTAIFDHNAGYYVSLSGTTDDRMAMLSNAIRVTPGINYRIRVRARHAGAAARTVQIYVVACTADLPQGYVAVKPQSTLIHPDNNLGYYNSSDNTLTFLQNFELAAANTWEEDDVVYTPAANVKWISLCIYNNDAIDGVLDLDRVSMEIEPGLLVNKDSTGQYDIELYAATRVAFASNTISSIDIDTLSWVEVETVDLTLPATITDSAVRLAANFAVEGHDTSTSEDRQLVYRIDVRLLDDDNAVIKAFAFYFTQQPDRVDETNISSGSLHGNCAINCLVNNAALNANEVNTFKLQVQSPTLAFDTLVVNNPFFEAALHNQAD